MWQDHHDAQMRANNTVVLYKNEPVYIVSIDHDCACNMVYLKDGRKAKAKITSQIFDWTPVPCGYVNLSSGIAYVQRKPIRKWKQGLHRDNIEVLTDRPMRTNDIHRTKQFRETVLNVYPKLGEALSAVQKGDAPAKAFSREFGLVKSRLGLVYLDHRGVRVGWNTLGDNFQFADGFVYLKEALEEARA